MILKRTINKVVFSTVIALLVMPSVSMADPIKVEGEFGLSSSSGNSDTQNIIAKLNLTKKSGAWFHEVGLAAISSTESDETTAERYLITGKTGRDLTSKVYVFGSGKYDKDLFSGFESQSTLAVGVGSHVIQSDRQTLDIEVGPGFRFSETDDGENQDEFVVRGGLFYNYKFTETARFKQNFVVEAGSDNTTIDSETAIIVKISEAVSLKASLLIKNNSDVPDGVSSTDSLTAISLTYGF